jgi:hypothetical protein
MSRLRSGEVAQPPEAIGKRRSDLAAPTIRLSPDNSAQPVRTFTSMIGDPSDIAPVTREVDQVSEVNDEADNGEALTGVI